MSSVENVNRILTKAGSATQSPTVETSRRAVGRRARALAGDDTINLYSLGATYAVARNWQLACSLGHESRSVTGNAGYGYYDNTKLFRTDTSIGIIQGGAPHTNSAADTGPGFTIPDEGGPFTYKPGQLVMARTNQPNSAAAQFFFTVDDNASKLDGAGTYVVFGTVTQGLDVLEKILASNVLNTVQFTSIDTVVNSPTFGQVTAVRPMRRFQLLTRFRF